MYLKNMETRHSRRHALQLLSLSGLGLLAPRLSYLFNSKPKMMSKPIPSSGEALPLVGLGTWQTFDVGGSSAERAPLQEVLQHMVQQGGSMIDSSPMYGRSEAVVGALTKELDIQKHFFYATKVWTSGRQEGIQQMEDSLRKMRRQQMDLMQIHNLLDWRTHLRTLQEWKEKGKIRYIGITHYTDSSHEQLEQIIRTEKIDFVQFNYSILDRNAEKRLLPAAQERGVATIINRPYEGGRLFRMIKGKALPEWAAEYQIKSWGQFFLKYLLSHPAVNCVIPGTAKPKHLLDNMGAGYGSLPDEKRRKAMVKLLE